MMGLSRLKDLLLLIQSNWFNWQKLVRGLNKLPWLRFYWWSINHNTLKLNQVKRACKRSFQFYKDNKRSCINSTYTAWHYLTWIATFKGTNKQIEQDSCVTGYYRRTLTRSQSLLVFAQWMMGRRKGKRSQTVVPPLSQEPLLPLIPFQTSLRVEWRNK